MGAINLHAPEAMVKELHKIANYGGKAVFLRPNPVKGRLLSDSVYEPFWTECEVLGIAVGIHEGTHSRLSTIGADRFNSRFALHACSHPMEQMMALLALIEGGVLERHPQLKFGFLESGCARNNCFCHDKPLLVILFYCSSPLRRSHNPISEFFELEANF